jgi:hypothetical protein
VGNRIMLARLLAVASVVYAAAFYIVGGALEPGYSHSANFISELNATGTPWAQECSPAYHISPLGQSFPLFSGRNPS